MYKTKKLKKSGYFVKSLTDEERFGTNKLKAIIYVRVSSEGQVTGGHGLESQESVCRDRCQKQPGLEIEVVKIFREEGVSGKSMDRKSINEAIKFLEKENRKYTKIHYFVVTDADRIARPDDIAEAFTLEQSIECLGAKIITVNNKRDMETDEGKFLHTIQYAIAGLERRKILRRTMNGRLSSLKNGSRPFTSPSVGYIRERYSDKGYQDLIDEIKGPIIKEGLEHYAYNPMFTKSQLHKFRVEKGLQTNYSSNSRLYLSFVDKTFVDFRLYFYAGYIYYPEWGVDTPIKGKHEPLVSLDVIEKIMEKENSKMKSRKSPDLDENLEIHPLKGLITCTGCARKIGCYASKGNGGVYYYYTCGNKYCTNRINVRKEIMETRFEELIEKMELPKEVFDVFKTFILEEWEKNKKTMLNSIPHIQGQILSIQSKMKKIEEKLLSISNEGLIKKMEEEWSTLETLEEDLKKKINNQKNDEDNFEVTLSQAEYMFINPVGIWKNSNYEIRQLLFRVRFSGILYYEKNLGYRTNDTTGLHYLFSSEGDTDYRVMAQGGVSSNQFHFSKIEFGAMYTILIAQSKYINAIYKVSEKHRLNLG